MAPVLSWFGRFGEPQELAQARLWLCSDRASCVTGATLAVDAGSTADVERYSLPQSFLSSS